jgi:hypothetical protein
VANVQIGLSGQYPFGGMEIPSGLNYVISPGGKPLHSKERTTTVKG